MRYVIYIHCWKDEAKVHNISCRYYQQRSPLGNSRGVWTEPILSFEMAMQQIRRLGKTNVSACGTCCRGM